MRSFFRLFGVGISVTLVTLLIMVSLPHDKYIRWQAIKTEAFARLGWIYERIHFDDTPIDIAFIGTSHTMMGIDTPTFEKDINNAGARVEDGKRCIHVVSLALPAYGRDLHWIIGRELLMNRKIKVLVLEVFENETRQAHPLFVHVADVSDILEAPKLINLNYVHNLVRLPFRQLSLWIKSLSPKMFGLKQHFDFSDYDGSDVDNTHIINVDGAAFSPFRDRVMDSSKLEAVGKLHLEGKNLHVLGSWGEPYEYAVPNYYVTALLDLARDRGVQVVFLYLPQYGMQSAPVDDHLYRGRGDWVFVNDVLENPQYWFDAAHLNAQGADKATQRIASEFLSRWKSSPATMKRDGIFFQSSVTPCNDHAYPPRSSLTPFHSTQKNDDDADAP